MLKYERKQPHISGWKKLSLGCLNVLGHGLLYESNVYVNQQYLLYMTFIEKEQKQE